MQQLLQGKCSVVYKNIHQPNEQRCYILRFLLNLSCVQQSKSLAQPSNFSTTTWNFSSSISNFSSITSRNLVATWELCDGLIRVCKQLLCSMTAASGLLWNARFVGAAAMVAFVAPAPCPICWAFASWLIGPAIEVVAWIRASTEKACYLTWLFP